MEQHIHIYTMWGDGLLESVAREVGVMKCGMHERKASAGGGHGKCHGAERACTGTACSTPCDGR